MANDKYDSDNDEDDSDNDEKSEIDIGWNKESDNFINQDGVTPYGNAVKEEKMMYIN